MIHKLLTYLSYFLDHLQHQQQQQQQYNDGTTVVTTGASPAAPPAAFIPPQQYLHFSILTCFKKEVIYVF